MDRSKDILSSIYGVRICDLMDIEKIIKGIQECDLNGGLIGNCPYKGILAMLKEQEAVVRCKDCKNLDYTNSHWFCKWLNRCVDVDWFCAAGRKGEGNNGKDIY